VLAARHHAPDRDGLWGSFKSLPGALSTPSLRQTRARTTRAITRSTPAARGSIVTVKEAVAPPSDYPPPGMEVRLIQRFVPLKGRSVLELGCGDGRLTRQFAPLASSVVAVEPDPARIALAKSAAASEGITNVSFRVGSAERLPIRGGPFDIALFSWSL
jgi:SAM-dependent methyltransferase